MIRTAASLLFESFKSVVRKRHTLKGAGVRVSSVAGRDLPTPRLPTPVKSTATTTLADPKDVPPSGGDALDTLGDGRSVGLAYGNMPSASAAAAVVAFSPPPPPAGLLEAVGMGVISVSPGGVALIEQLGRGAAPAGDLASGSIRHGEFGQSLSAPAGDRGAVADDGGESEASADRQETSTSLWRLRAARRRRKARGDKMRALVTWAASGQAGDKSRVDGVGSGVPDPFARDVGRAVTSGRVMESGGRSEKEANLADPAMAEAASRAGGLGVGWGVKFQAHAARAIPASFLTKRL